jgi:cytochrome c peroxidase
VGKNGLTYFRRVLYSLIGLALASVPVTSQKIDKRDFKFPKAIPAPTDNQPTLERVKLGKMLFFDPRISGSQWISCATCHNPVLGWSDGLPTALGNGMLGLKRSTPPITDSGFDRFLMWDGRYHNLEDQAVGPIQAKGEMNGSIEHMVATLKSKPGYVSQFERAYPGTGITQDTVAKAMASFERTIVSNDSPFDDWVNGKQKAMSAGAERGFALFAGKAKCALCHQPPFFSDDGFHNIGLKGDDQGRYSLVPVKVLQGSFKTPTLRNVARTAPYMHNGAYSTLIEVVEHYNRGGDTKEHLDPNIGPLNLSGAEEQDLVEFLRSLTGRPQKIVLPRLPE